jgi:hypothetical protein
MAITHANPTGGGGRSSLENQPARTKSGKNTARKSTGGKAPRKNRMSILDFLALFSLDYSPEFRRQGSWRMVCRMSG